MIEKCGGVNVMFRINALVFLKRIYKDAELAEKLVIAEEIGFIVSAR